MYVLSFLHLGLCFHNLGVIVSSLAFLAAGLIQRCPFIHVSSRIDRTFLPISWKWNIKVFHWPHLDEQFTTILFLPLWICSSRKRNRVHGSNLLGRRINTENLYSIANISRHGSKGRRSFRRITYLLQEYREIFRKKRPCWRRRPHF